ncbi:MAG: transcription antitermination factor NusB [Planctomycetota bacterium]
MLPTDPRQLVVRRIAGQVRRFPAVAIGPLDTGDLAPRDAALAAAIDHAVAARWITLRAILQTLTTQQWDKLEPVVRASLLVGAAQLLLLDRVPDHAAIDSSVEACKAQRPKAAGLVNAVLRRLAGLRSERVETCDRARRDEVPREDGGAWRLTEDVFNADDAKRLGQVTGHAGGLIDRWIDRLGWEKTAEVAWHGLAAPPVILAGVPADDARVEAHEQAGFVVLREAGDLAGVLADHPGARVQDPTAGAAVAATASIAPGCIVDVCAGRGTKTRQLADLHPTASIVATDPGADHRAQLERILAGRPDCSVRAAGPMPDLAGQADLVLLDVPCSNTGVLARRPEARYRFGDAPLASLIDLQRQIIADALPLLADGGTLVYATCSIDPDENQGQVEWMTHWHPLHVVSAWSQFPVGQPGDPPTAYRDGRYFAMLRHR